MAEELENLQKILVLVILKKDISLAVQHQSQGHIRAKNPDVDNLEIE